MAEKAIPDTGLTKFFITNFRKRPDMIPIIGLVCSGLALGAFIGIRTLMYSPDVVIQRSKHPEPWNELRDKQYKLITTRDYSEPCPAPEY